MCECDWIEAPPQWHILTLTYIFFLFGANGDIDTCHIVAVTGFLFFGLWTSWKSRTLFAISGLEFWFLRISHAYKLVLRAGFIFRPTDISTVLAACEQFVLLSLFSQLQACVMCVTSPTYTFLGNPFFSIYFIFLLLMLARSYPGTPTLRCKRKTFSSTFAFVFVVVVVVLPIHAMLLFVSFSPWINTQYMCALRKAWLCGSWGEKKKCA